MIITKRISRETIIRCDLETILVAATGLVVSGMIAGAIIAHLIWRSAVS